MPQESFLQPPAPLKPGSSDLGLEGRCQCFGEEEERLNTGAGHKQPPAAPVRGRLSQSRPPAPRPPPHIQEAGASSSWVPGKSDPEVSEEHLALKSRGPGRDPKPWGAVPTHRGCEQAGARLRPVAKAVLGQPRDARGRGLRRAEGSEARPPAPGTRGGGSRRLVLAVPRARAAARGADAADRAGRGAARSPGRRREELAAAGLQPPPSTRRSAAAPARASDPAGEPRQALLRPPGSPASEPEGAAMTKTLLHPQPGNTEMTAHHPALEKCTPWPRAPQHDGF
ncbi:translation initiation factor IF-2-like [Rhinolophus ferrumequinum]|uniref:translation initiation factor IF-2-like n=1 Tax=Rhinolophus ferrumequinum TaxID=59479 RepID=UPI00140FCFCA|nr:translation initiation factor IF-2-like [Rhinolophus ferrumequinum]